MRHVVAALLLAAFASAWAAGPMVVAPPDRIVEPGEFVTLVFRVEGSGDGSGVVSASLPEGWRSVRTPDAVALRSGVAVPLVLTVGVPPDAAAATTERVLVRVETTDGSGEQGVLLTVAAAYGLELEAPTEVVVGVDSFLVRVENTGNVLDVVDVAVLRVGRAVASERIEVAAGGSVTVEFDVGTEGSYVVTATSVAGTIQRRNVSLIRFGGPQPEPFVLEGGIALRGTPRPSLDAVVTLAGPVSERVRLDAGIGVPSFERAHLELRTDDFAARLGSGWRDPFRLGLPTDTLFAASLRRQPWTAGAVIAGPIDDPATVAIAGLHTWLHGEVAAAIGRQRGEPLLAIRGGFAGDTWTVGVAGRIEGGDPQARFDATLAHAWGATAFGFDAAQFDGDQTRLAFEVRHRTELTSWYADARLPLEDASAWEGRIGVTATFGQLLPGDLLLGAQIGHLERLLRVEYRHALGHEWRAQSAIGFRSDADGSALVGEARLLRVLRDQYAAYEVRVGFSPTTSQWGAHVATQQQRAHGPWSWTADAAWDVGERRLTTNADVAHEQGPWRVAVDVGLTYAYGDLTGSPWNVGLTLQGRYAWAWRVPEPVTTLAGGRRVGVVAGSVEAAGVPIAGARIEVGSYRLLTDDQGRFEVALPPGEYEFRLDTRSVPVVNRLVDAPLQRVVLAEGDRVPIAWRAIQTTVLDGVVLESTRGDGVPDEPARGVAARVLILAEDGLRRLVVTGVDGTFQVRGLAPGRAVVRLVEVPFGATIVGEREQTIVLYEGVRGEVRFLVEPVRARAQSFTAPTVRIRSAAVERDRVPPGAAPVVRVQVSGDADAVQLRFDGTTVDLRLVDGAWIGRLPLPSDLGDGPLSFTAVAIAGGAEVTRRTQVQIDAAAPLIDVTTDAPVRAGSTLTIEARAVLDLVEIDVQVGSGERVAFREATIGHWVAALVIPDTMPEGIAEVQIRALDASGTPYVVTQSFRVLGP